MTESELISALRGLPNEDLARILGIILPERSPFVNEPGVEHSRMFLGVYSKYSDEHSISIIAYPKNDEHGPYWGFYQSAESPIAGVEFISCVKQAISPFDETHIHLT
jgi:hypothetical protein